jgi:hypothetical protein
MERLKAVLEAYAFIAHDRRGQHDTELGAPRPPTWPTPAISSCP